VRLYQHPLSFNARRVVLTALHLAVPVELVQVDLAKRENLTPDFVRMNPNHKVPVLEDGEFHLWESYAIMQYLAEKTPGQTLYPADVRERADVNRWLFWCAQHLSPAISILNWENFVKGILGLGGPSPAEVQRGEQLFTPLAGILDAQLAGRPWICGPMLTLADFAIAAPLGDAATAKLPLDPYANIHRWLQQVKALPAWKQAVPQLSI
jgi:glutathione S-transferase